MGHVGKKFTLVDEKTGKEETYQFPDTPLNRWTGGFYSACASFGLSEPEVATLHLIIMLAGKTGKAQAKHLSGELFKEGLQLLLKRGWAVRPTPKTIAIPDSISEIEQIMKSAETAVHFGDSEPPELATFPKC